MKKTVTTLFFIFTFLFAAASYSQIVSTLVTGPSTFDDCLTLSASGDLFASRYNGTTITKITPAGMTSIFASGLSTPNGTAFGPGGYLYVTNNIANGRITRLSPAGVMDTLIASIPYPTSIFFESDTSMLIPSYQTNKIYRAKLNGTYTELYSGQGMNGPVDIDRASDGNLLVANYTDGKIFKVAGGVFTQIAKIPGPLGFMCVANNFIYATGFGNNRIYKITMAGDTSTFAGTGQGGQTNGPVRNATFNAPNGITASRTGDTLYISDYNARSLRMITGVRASIQNISSNTPAKFSLKQNYPNPFNPSTTIEFDITKKSAVLLEVFDSLGKNIVTLVNAELNAGTYRTEFNASGLSSGMYFVKLSANGSSLTNKIMLTK
ncbi:MAG: T9SS type A sorting domain-containing protein [Ignavibacteria bacterium]|nr:T9SS type A sorting domain-containing protein [Ignavibacteria bacterium]